MFSTLFLSFVAAVSLYSFLLLVETRNKVPASFGDIGGVLFGRTMRMLVLIAITTSQVNDTILSSLKKNITQYGIFAKNRLVLCVPTWSLSHKVYRHL